MIAPMSLLGLRDKRTTFLSVGVTLCILIAAICVAPLPFVGDWIAIWLLCLLSILVMGTFSIWAFHAIRNPRLLDSEQNREQMAAIALFGQNVPGKSPLLRPVDQTALIENPNTASGQQEALDAAV